MVGQLDQGAHGGAQFLRPVGRKRRFGGADDSGPDSETGAERFGQLAGADHAQVVVVAGSARVVAECDRGGFVSSGAGTAAGGWVAHEVSFAVDPEARSRRSGGATISQWSEGGEVQRYVHRD